MADQSALADRERAVAASALDVEKSRTDIANQATALQAERAAFYKSAFEAVTKKSTFLCKLKNIFLLGNAKCIK